MVSLFVRLELAVIETSVHGCTTHMSGKDLGTVVYYCSIVLWFCCEALK